MYIDRGPQDSTVEVVGRDDLRLPILRATVNRLFETANREPWLLKTNLWSWAVGSLKVPDFLHPPTSRSSSVQFTRSPVFPLQPGACLPRITPNDAWIKLSSRESSTRIVHTFLSKGRSVCRVTAQELYKPRLLWHCLR